MGFKENLRDEIEYQGLMLKDIAEKAGLPQNSMSNYLREKSSIPSADIAVKIARALNVSVEYLVLGKENKIGQITQPNYDSQIRKIADRIQNMTNKEKFLVESVVDAIEKSRNQNNS